jgi:hypothetical protein
MIGKPVTRPIEIGSQFEGPARKLSAARILAFPGGPFGAPGWPAHHLHTDLDKAAEAGLPAPIASGLRLEGYLVELLCDVFRKSWVARGTLQVRYPRPVMAVEIIQPIIQITTLESAGPQVRIGLDVWCCRVDGEKILVGSASCSIPA